MLGCFPTNIGGHLWAIVLQLECATWHEVLAKHTSGKMTKVDQKFKPFPISLDSDDICHKPENHSADVMLHCTRLACTPQSLRLPAALPFSNCCPWLFFILAPDAPMIGTGGLWLLLPRWIPDKSHFIAITFWATNVWAKSNNAWREPSMPLGPSCIVETVQEPTTKLLAWAQVRNFELLICSNMFDVSSTSG